MTTSRGISVRLLTPGQRFDRFVIPEPNSGCFLWLGSTTPQGYGSFWDGLRLVRAPRYAWEQANGPIPPGQWVLHRCDNPSCVNTAHLFLGDNATNVRDCAAKKRLRNQRVAHCPAGHGYTTENTYVDKQGRRACRACVAARAKVYAEKHREWMNLDRSLRRKGSSLRAVRAEIHALRAAVRCEEEGR